MAAFFIAGCAGSGAPAAPVCYDANRQANTMFVWRNWLDDLHAQNGDVAMYRLSKFQRDQFVAAFNVTPPYTSHDPHEVVMFSRADRDVVLVVFVEGGCVTATIPVERAVMNRFLSLQEPAVRRKSREPRI